LTIEAQNELNRLAIAKRPGRIGNADDPRAIGILRKDEREAVIKFGDGATVGKSTFVACVRSALPLPDANDAERTSGETCGVERDASKR
jgi:hypothetical protein